ncbi:MAG: DUF4358 domain-containing protein [Lachnospiraceae bacterium]|nr:DUF4358 domain-containing protein [Lachnospiraceae bacterium]
MSTKRWLIEGGIVLCLIAMVFLTLHERDLRDIAPVEIEQSMKKQFSGMQKASDILLRKNFGIERDAVEGAVYYAASDFMDVREILILKTEEESVLTGARDTILARIEEEKEIFESYGPEQFAQLQNAQIWMKAPWLVAVICDDSAELCAQIRGMIER